jgi:hypothetical protein
MVVSELKAVDKWLADYGVLREAIERLRDCARNEQWDQVNELAAQQASMVSRLGGPVPAKVSEQLGAAQVSQLIQELADANDEAIVRLEAWRSRLGESLQQIGSAQTNVNRLRKMYR